MMLKNLSQIDTNTIEGRYLMAALSQLAVLAYPSDEPDTILAKVGDVQAHIFQNADPIPEPATTERPSFEVALTNLVNRYSLENKSDTPDWILAEHMIASLHAFEQTSNARRKWWGNKDGFHPGEDLPRPFVPFPDDYPDPTS